VLPRNSKLLRNFATPCGLSLRSGRLTAINREIPAKFPQIRLRRTSVNRDVIRNNFKGLKKERGLGFMANFIIKLYFINYYEQY